MAYVGSASTNASGALVTTVSGDSATEETYDSFRPTEDGISGMDLVALMLGVAGDQMDRLLKIKAGQLKDATMKAESLAAEGEALRAQIDTDREAEKQRLGDGYKESEFHSDWQDQLDSNGDKVAALNLTSQQFMQELQLLSGKASAIEKAQDGTQKAASEALKSSASNI